MRPEILSLFLESFDSSYLNARLKDVKIMLLLNDVTHSIWVKVFISYFCKICEKTISDNTILRILLSDFYTFVARRAKKSSFGEKARSDSFNNGLHYLP